MYDVIGWIAHQNFLEPFLHVDWVTIDAGGHIAVRKCLEQLLVRRSELVCQRGDATLIRLDRRASVVRNQPAHHLIGPQSVAQVAGPVERMKASHLHSGRVTDVMQPRGDLDQLRTVAQHASDSPCPRCHTLGVSPPPRQLTVEQPTGDKLGLVRVDHTSDSTTPHRDMSGTSPDISERLQEMTKPWLGSPFDQILSKLVRYDWNISLSSPPRK
jgi:hypothetical protein